VLSLHPRRLEVSISHEIAVVDAEHGSERRYKCTCSIVEIVTHSFDIGDPARKLGTTLRHVGLTRWLCFRGPSWTDWRSRWLDTGGNFVGTLRVPHCTSLLVNGKRLHITPGKVGVTSVSNVRDFPEQWISNEEVVRNWWQFWQRTSVVLYVTCTKPQTRQAAWSLFRASRTFIVVTRQLQLGNWCCTAAGVIPRHIGIRFVTRTSICAKLRHSSL
jgi:hypothetical protein